MTLARRNSFDEGVRDCFAGDLRTRVTKVRSFKFKRLKMDHNSTQNDQHGAKLEPR